MSAAAPFKLLRVLVLDPCKDTADSTAMLVEAWGYPAHSTSCLADALRQAADCCPDVVVLDIDRPGKPGWDVVRQLRFLPAFSEARFVAVTSWTRQEDHAREAGCDRYFIKPADPRALQETLRHFTKDVPSHDP